MLSRRDGKVSQSVDYHAAIFNRNSNGLDSYSTGLVRVSALNDWRWDRLIELHSTGPTNSVEKIC
jgi:hypothetical protein